MCCGCGDAVRGVVCHDADGRHSLHVGCNGLRLSHCSCAGYPLATPPRQPFMSCQSMQCGGRVPLGDLTNVPETSPQVVRRRGNLWSLGRIDMDSMSDDTSPSSVRTDDDTSSPSNTSVSVASFGDSFSMECDGAQESTTSMVVQVIALSGQLLCELHVSPSTLVIGIKIRLEKALDRPVRQQDLLWGFCLLNDQQSLGSAILWEERAPPGSISINLVSKMAPPQPNYLSFQEHVKKRHRYMLVDWLISVHASEEAQQRSLFLAVSFIDLYLSQRQFVPFKNGSKDLKLLGIAAFLIACKCDTSDPHAAPTAWNSILHDLQQDLVAPASDATTSKFARLTFNAYTVEELVNMEREVIDVIGLQSTTVYHHSVVTDYLKPFHSLGIFGERHLKLIAYLTEHSLMSLRMLKHDPSRIAAAAVLTSNRLMGWDVVWPAAVSKELPYQEHELRQCSRELDRIVSCLSSPSSEYKALQKKFPSYQLTGPSVNAARGGA